MDITFIEKKLIELRKLGITTETLIKVAEDMVFALEEHENFEEYLDWRYRMVDFIIHRLDRQIEEEEYAEI